MSLQETLRSIRSTSAPTNEETTKFKIIAPILTDLGWDMSGPNVLLEFSVGGKNAGGRVDIALKGSRGVVALIEAKTPGTNLDAHVDQILGYAFREGVDICALTTGLKWWLYMPREKGLPEKRRFTTMDIINDPIEQLADDLEAFLSRSALEDGKAIDQAKRVLQAQHERTLLGEKIPSIWRAMIEKPDEELLETIIKRTYQETNLRPHREQIVAVLRGQPLPAATISNQVSGVENPIHNSSTHHTAPRAAPPYVGNQISGNKSPTHKSPTHTPERPQHTSATRFQASILPAPAPQSGTSTRKSTPRPKAIVLLGQRRSVKTHKDVLVSATEILHQRDPKRFTKLLDLGGRNHMYLSLDEAAVGRTPMPVGTSGYFVDTHLSAQSIVKRVQLFLRHLGYNGSELELEYDTSATRSQESIPPAPAPQSGTSTRKITPRPKAIVLLGQRRSVKFHQDVLVSAAEILYQRDPERFTKLLDLGGRKLKYLSRDRAAVGKTPKPVGTSGYFVDTNLSGQDIVERVQLFLRHLGYNGSELELEYDTSATRFQESILPAPAPQSGTSTRKSTRKMTPRPKAIVLLGQRRSTKTHKDVLVSATEILHQRDPERFTKLLDLGGRKRMYLSLDEAAVGSRPTPVGTSGYFVNADLSAQDIVERVQLFLRHLGYNGSELELEYD